MADDERSLVYPPEPLAEGEQGKLCDLERGETKHVASRSGHTEAVKRSFITSGCQAQISFVYSLTFSAESLLAIAR